MKVAIMQPYFFPYIGYFQLINSVDEFIIYDNIQYTKKGWINRNRILVEDSDKLITLPLKKDSDYLDIVNRKLSDDWVKEKTKLLNQISTAYKKAPHYKDVYELIQNCVNYNDLNLFNFINNSVGKICDYIGIYTKIIISSTINIDHTLKSQDKVIAICKTLKADKYINTIGGIQLYDKEIFKQYGIELNFIQSNPINYKQYNNTFVPWLSIIDVLMFNPKEVINNFVNSYTLT